MTDVRPEADRDAPGPRRFISPALFAVVAICFFLPFVTIACNAGGQELIDQFGDQFGATPAPTTPEGGELEETLTGWDLVTANTEEGDPGTVTGAPAGEQELGQVSDSQPLAIAAFAIAVLGIALSWLALWTGPIAGSVLGIAGVVVLFMLKGKVEGIIPSGAGIFGGADLIEFRWEIGFWIAMAAFGLAAAWSIFRLLTEARMRSARPGAGQGTTMPPPPPGPTAAPPSTAPPTPPPPPE